MYPQYHASLGSRLAGDFVWYLRAAIRILPEVFGGVCFMVLFLSIPVIAAFLA